MKKLLIYILSYFFCTEVKDTQYFGVFRVIDKKEFVGIHYPVRPKDEKYWVYTFENIYDSKEQYKQETCLEKFNVGDRVGLEYKILSE